MPVTHNHWVACATCHVEGRSDAVTWKFAQGPRDTPTNAGGLLGTGFLFRTADRTHVQDYWKTINVEQGGHFSVTNPAQKTLLDAIAAFVNDALPAPIPPRPTPTCGARRSSLRAQGETVFAQAGCATCHRGPPNTDSGIRQPVARFDWTRRATPPRVLLHDVGTCVQSGIFPTSPTPTSPATRAAPARSTRPRFTASPTPRPTCTTAAR